MIFSISTLFALHSIHCNTTQKKIVFSELCVHINRKGKCYMKWMAYKCCWIYDELDNRNVRKMSVACIVLRKRLNAFRPIAFQTSMKISANNSLEMLVIEAGVWCIQCNTEPFLMHQLIVGFAAKHSMWSILSKTVRRGRNSCGSMFPIAINFNEIAKRICNLSIICFRNHISLVNIESFRQFMEIWKFFFPFFHLIVETMHLRNFVSSNSIVSFTIELNSFIDCT